MIGIIILVICLSLHGIYLCVLNEVGFFTGLYQPVILSPHKTHNVLRTKLEKLPFKCVVGLGWKWIEDRNCNVEINDWVSIRNAADKLRMKLCFNKHNIITAKWYMFHESVDKFPIVAKHRFGSRGTGNYLLKTKYEFNRFIKEREGDLDNFIFEEFLDYPLEYRLHISEQGCFYTNRKALKNDVNNEDRWKFSYNNTVWLKEENEKFNKPENWNEIIDECIKALKSCGLDVAAFDVKYQPKTNKFFIIEVNSAPSFGDFTKEKYLEFLPMIAKYKFNKTTLLKI